VTPGCWCTVPKSVVSHNIHDVTALVDRAVEVLWSSCYHGQSGERLQPESVSIGDDNASIDARSQAVYQRLVYDITAQAITALCNNCSTPETSQPWQQQHTISAQPVPQSAEEAKPLITASVLEQLGLETRRPPLLPRCLGRIRGRRHADQLDEMLAVELVGEESAWTDYSEDELFVKMQVSDMLFDMMISDTVSTLSGVIAGKRQQWH